MIHIRERRLRLSISQAKLAAEVRVNQTAISQWERGIVTPSLDNAKRLADALGCTIDELYEDEPGKEVS